jgi:hypothetical protein
MRVFRKARKGSILSTGCGVSFHLNSSNYARPCARKSARLCATSPPAGNCSCPICDKERNLCALTPGRVHPLAFNSTRGSRKGFTGTQSNVAAAPRDRDRIAIAQNTTETKSFGKGAAAIIREPGDLLSFCCWSGCARSCGMTRGGKLKPRPRGPKKLRTLISTESAVGRGSRNLNQENVMRTLPLFAAFFS